MLWNYDEMFCNSSDLHYELLFLKAIKIGEEH